MRMRQVPQITVPANGSIELKPGSFHVMLIKLKQPLKEGDAVNVTLNFDDGSKKDVAMTAQRVMRPMMHNQEGKKCGGGMKCGGGKCGGMR
jgi:copper(I)-binding protein